MGAKVRKLLCLLQAELDDSIEDFETMLGLWREAPGRHTSTEYVSRENSALLAREIEGVRSVARKIGNLVPAEFSDLEAAELAVRDAVRQEVRLFEFPEAIVFLVERKLRRVRRYLDDAACDDLSTAV